MGSIGFTQSSSPPRPRSFPIWVVLFVDTYAEKPERRVAGAFTSEVEARKLIRELQELHGSRFFEYLLEPALLYKTNEDWRPHPTNPLPYETVPGLNQAKALIPEFRGYRCQTVNRIVLEEAGRARKTRGLEIGWTTGAYVRFGIESPGALLITQRAWNPPSQTQADSASDLSRDASRWRSEAVKADDPLTVLSGNEARGVEVTENEDGSISAIRVRFKVGTLVVTAQRDEFLVELVKGSSAG